ncbi:hypothetical protein B4102_3135 [Heyndrickxia sporothermodurans]|uniref:Uncharacterized protein n=1 Tax=Heyndrickxia sporothermodurans TaxID=46224 RepID=A0A150L0G0_9BACI|nr:hypothetical protein B4102_3135 [Heyndrickxia sporothermodurans]
MFVNKPTHLQQVLPSFLKHIPEIFISYKRRSKYEMGKFKGKMDVSNWREIFD